MTDEGSRPVGSTLEPMAFDEQDKKLLRAAFDPAPARVDAVKGAVVARIAALAAAGASAGTAGTASADATSAAASAGGAGATSAALSWGAAQWIGAGVVAIAVATGAVVALRTEPVPEPAATHAAVAAPVSAALREPSVARAPLPAAPAPAVAVVEEPRAIEQRAIDAVRDDAARAVGSERPRAASSARERATPRRARRSELENTSGATALEDTRDAHVESSAAKPASVQAEPRQPSAQPEPQPVAQPLAESLGRELAMLRKARAALERGSASLAISVLDEYGALFPQGVLRQEELATRALALCESGRKYEARQAARALARLAPRSPHLIRLADSCALRETTSEHDADEATDDR